MGGEAEFMGDDILSFAVPDWELTEVISTACFRGKLCDSDELGDGGL